MIPTTMQSIIDDAFGTFDYDMHEVYRYDDSSGVFIVPNNIVCSYETAGGVMFDWVPCVLEEED